MSSRRGAFEQAAGLALTACEALDRDRDGQPEISIWALTSRAFLLDERGRAAP